MAYSKQEDQNACQRRWYNKNKEKSKQKVRERKYELLAWFKEYKSTLKCSVCGESETCCLDFHHINPDEKERNMREFIHDGCSRDTILKEINRCLVLCSNCHRKEHKRLREIDLNTEDDITL